TWAGGAWSVGAWSVRAYQRFHALTLRRSTPGRRKVRSGHRHGPEAPILPTQALQQRGGNFFVFRFVGRDCIQEFTELGEALGRTGIGREQCFVEIARFIEFL